MRRAARVDANQSDIVHALRQVGALVKPTHTVGDGFPDLVVYHPRCGLFLAEVKDGTAQPSKRRLTEQEAAFHEEWHGAPVYVVESVEDAIAIVTGGIER